MAIQEQPDGSESPARRIAAQLLGGARGVSLVGPQPQTDDIVAHLLRDLDRDRLLPVPVRAASTTPALLREAAHHAHAGRGALDTVLLLVVPDAGRLSADMLRELEQAAEAAISPGGLKFVLASTAPLSAILRDAGLTHLHDCLDAHVTATPEPVTVAAERRSLVDRPVAAAGPSRRRLGWLVAGGLVLAGLLLAGLLLLHGSRPARRPPPPPRSAPQAPVRVPVPVPARISPQPPPAPAPVAPPPVLPPPASPPPGPPPAVPARPDTATPGASPLLLVAQPGDTLPVLYAKVYAGNTPPPYSEVVALNPVLAAGTRLVFPAPPGGWRSRP